MRIHIRLKVPEIEHQRKTVSVDKVNNLDKLLKTIPIKHLKIDRLHTSPHTHTHLCILIFKGKKTKKSNVIHILRPTTQ